MKSLVRGVGMKSPTFPNEKTAEQMLCGLSVMRDS